MADVGGVAAVAAAACLWEGGGGRGEGVHPHLKTVDGVGNLDGIKMDRGVTGARNLALRANEKRAPLSRHNLLQSIH